MNYRVYHYAGWEENIIANTIEEAMNNADELIAYCGESIYLTDGESTYMRRWWGVPATDDDRVDDIIVIGSGFYEAWSEV